MKKYNVKYESGESRHCPGIGIDYMLVTIEKNGEEIELYAETGFDPMREDDTDTYDDLKGEIIRQAAEIGIERNQLIFFYDE